MFCPKCGRYYQKDDTCSDCKCPLIKGPSDKDYALLRERLSAAFAKKGIAVKRGGPTGTGKAWEEELGVRENNSERPDLACFEIKSLVLDQSNPLTLKSKKLPANILEAYGITNEVIYEDQCIEGHYGKCEKDVYYELGENGITWYLKQDSKYLKQKNRLEDLKGNIVLARWPFREIFSKITWTSFTFLRLLKSDVETLIKPEESYVIHFPKELIINLIKSHDLYYEIRLDPSTERGKRFLKDHGPGWRLKRKKLKEILQHSEVIVSKQARLWFD